jgi:hypothetical protein
MLSPTDETTVVTSFPRCRRCSPLLSCRHRGQAFSVTLLPPQPLKLVQCIPVVPLACSSLPQPRVIPYFGMGLTPIWPTHFDWARLEVNQASAHVRSRS